MGQGMVLIHGASEVGDQLAEMRRHFDSAAGPSTPEPWESCRETSAVFAETRYALNGDLRVAYRASREGPRDMVFVPNWFTCCELFPELPSTQGWVEAMTSLGRLVFFDHPGTGASDPVTADALPTVEQWADIITAVLDALGSREAILVTYPGAIATTALFAATHPSRTAALVVLNGQADPPDRTMVQDEAIAALLPRGEPANCSIWSIRTCRGMSKSGPHGREKNA